MAFKDLQQENGIYWIGETKQKDLDFLKEPIEIRKVKPVIDRRYPLSEVPAAIRYLEDGPARGKVAITVSMRTKPESK